MKKYDIILADPPWPYKKARMAQKENKDKFKKVLKDLKDELGLTYLFISHNLAVIDYIADRIAVMHRGRIVEIAPRSELFSSPTHPYTQSLLHAVPHPSSWASLSCPARNPDLFTDGSLLAYSILVEFMYGTQ